MTKEQWHAKIKKQLVDLNTFNSSYNSVIDTLAMTLEQRDELRKKFKDDGSAVLITKKSDRGAENEVVNPLITTIDKLNMTALQYWKELGLTPVSFKKMDQALEDNSGNEFLKALADLSD